MLSLQPAEINFGRVEFNKRYTRLLTLTNEQSTPLDFAIRPSNRERYTVYPSSINLPANTSTTVQIQLQVSKYANRKKAQTKGQRDSFKIKSRYFEQKVWSTWFLQLDGDDGTASSGGAGSGRAVEYPAHGDNDRAEMFDRFATTPATAPAAPAALEQETGRVQTSTALDEFPVGGSSSGGGLPIASDEEQQPRSSVAGRVDNDDDRQQRLGGSPDSSLPAPLPVPHSQQYQPNRRRGESVSPMMGQDSETSDSIDSHTHEPPRQTYVDGSDGLLAHQQRGQRQQDSHGVLLPRRSVAHRRAHSFDLNTHRSGESAIDDDNSSVRLNDGAAQAAALRNKDDEIRHLKAQMTVLQGRVEKTDQEATYATQQLVRRSSPPYSIRSHQHAADLLAINFVAATQPRCVVGVLGTEDRQQQLLSISRCLFAASACHHYYRNTLRGGVLTWTKKICGYGTLVPCATNCNIRQWEP